MRTEPGKAFRFYWIPGFKPVSGSPEAGSPELVIPALGITRTLAVIAAPIACTLDTSLRSVTFAAPVAALEGVVGEFGGAAWLDFGNAMQAPANVVAFPTATTGRLARPVRYHVDAAGELHWRIYYADLTALEIGALTRTVTWSVDFERDMGPGVPKLADQDQGTLTIAPKPFSTGLTHDDFVAAHPMMAHRVPGNQTSFEPQIASAVDELLMRLRPMLSTDETVDDLEGTQLKIAHGLLTAHLIARADQGAGYSSGPNYASEAQRAIELVFAARAKDADGDGEISPAERSRAGGMQTARVRPGYSNFER